MYKYTSGEIPTDSLSTYFARAIVTVPLFNSSLNASTGCQTFYRVRQSVPKDGTPEGY